MHFRTFGKEPYTDSGNILIFRSILSRIFLCNLLLYYDHAKWKQFWENDNNFMFLLRIYLVHWLCVILFNYHKTHLGIGSLLFHSYWWSTHGSVCISQSLIWSTSAELLKGGTWINSCIYSSFDVLATVLTVFFLYHFGSIINILADVCSGLFNDHIEFHL